MKKVICLVAMSALLAACSGGAGNDSNRNGISTPPLPQFYTVKPKVVDDNVILIENKRIELSKEPEGLLNYSLNFGKSLQIYNQQYTALGYLMPKLTNNSRLNQLFLGNTNIDDSVFIADHITFERLPKKGKVNYEGISFAPNSMGKLSLHVNFDEKFVGGLIYNQKATYGEDPKDIMLYDAPLALTKVDKTEVHFIGIASQDDKKYGYAGFFAGPQAQEVIGLVNNGNRNLKTGFIGKKLN